jgi:hypothetical protein
MNNIAVLANRISKSRSKYIELTQALKQTVICTACGKEYMQKKTGRSDIGDRVKMCDCLADGKIIDLERRN